MTQAQIPLTSFEPRPKSEAAVRAFTRLLRASASTTRLLSAELLEEHGLTINDYEALLVLSRADGQRLKRVDISRQLLLTPSGITRLLEGLERSGLVERASCESDARVTYAQLTDEGDAKLREASGTHVAGIREFFRGRFSEDEVRALGELLERLPLDPSDDVECSP